MDALFSEYSLQASLENQPLAVREEVERLEEDYILTVSEEDLVQALAEKAKWDPPILGEPYIAGDREVDVPTTDVFGTTFIAKASAVVVQIPFTGDETFFRMRPPSGQLDPPRATVHSAARTDSGFLELRYAGRGLTPEGVRGQIDEFVRSVNSYLTQIAVAAEEHNKNIADKIRPFVQARKQRILQRGTLVASIGLPMKRREGAPKTYAISDIRRKARIEMPQIKGGGFAPEPALAEQEYESILSIIRAMVNVMERSPKAFRHLKEEDLRWHFLFQLNGQYEGRATGETFNYNGKTDILIREKDRNVFIAECKFWKGKESLTTAVDQLLDRYVHWRDTKTAILVFNRNKDFGNVLGQIAATAEAHPCFKRRVSHPTESEWRYVFRNRDDPNREILLTVLAFDVPREP
jgi:hypothetical protein